MPMTTTVSEREAKLEDLEMARARMHRANAAFAQETSHNGGDLLAALETIRAAGLVPGGDTEAKRRAGMFTRCPWLRRIYGAQEIEAVGTAIRRARKLVGAGPDSRPLGQGGPEAAPGAGEALSLVEG